jgi:hypothetical protein
MNSETMPSAAQHEPGGDREHEARTDEERRMHEVGKAREALSQMSAHLRARPSTLSEIDDEREIWHSRREVLDLVEAEVELERRRHGDGSEEQNAIRYKGDAVAKRLALRLGRFRPVWTCLDLDPIAVDRPSLRSETHLDKSFYPPRQ